MDGYGDCPADYAHNSVVELRNKIDTLESKIYDLEVEKIKLNEKIMSLQEYADICHEVMNKKEK